jgi:hypothetical protein
MYIKNDNGPKMLPWGTPHVIVPASDEIPLLCTYCFLSDKYDKNQSTDRTPIALSSHCDLEILQVAYEQISLKILKQH